MIVVNHLDPDLAASAAALFTGQYRRIRRAFPMLSEKLDDEALVAERLRAMSPRSLMAIENGQLTGYLTWWVVDHFRGSGRRGAYVPEWGHGALVGSRADVYRALYRAASAEWTAAGCGVHAITLFADDEEAREAWFWNGFGLAVVDAARPAMPVPGKKGTPLMIRRATTADAIALSALDAEHVLHYAGPPIYMALPHVDSPDSFIEFIQRPKNSVWLALDGLTPAGFMRFTGYDFDAVAVLESSEAAFCNGAYVRPQYRGCRAGAALLDAALEHYASLGLAGLFTNFESFNPEAARFWPRYFQPVCYSLIRVPEVMSPSSSIKS